MTRAFSDQYTAEAVCTRDTLTQAVALSLNRDAVEALLVSVPGKLKLKLKSGFKKVKKKNLYTVVVSYFMWSGALDSSGALLSYPMILIV